MNCINCNAELPENSNYCSECGAKVENSNINNCSNCGEILKPEARFCHSCGETVTASVVRERSQKREATNLGAPKKNWFATTGTFLFIPIFAGIIILLFWKNRESEPLNTASGQQSMSNTAAMENVHRTLERLQQKVEVNPEDLVSIDSLAVMYAIAGSYEKASELYERHLKLEPDNKDIKIALGLTYHNLKRTDEAIALIKEVLDKEPTYAFALFYLGEIYASSGNMEEASKNWKLIQEQYPNSEIAKMAEQRIHAYLQTNSNN
ncbi:MAG: tetratricopeptide repeat protein [bacterium]